MLKFLIALILLNFSFNLSPQNVLTPEILWQLGRVSAECLSPDSLKIIYGVTYYNKEENKSERNLYSVPLKGGASKQITTTPGAEYNVVMLPNGNMAYLFKSQLWESDWDGVNAKQIFISESGLSNVRFSPDGKYIMYTQDVKTGLIISDRYPDLDKANAKIIDGLMYRHWDTWEDEYTSHIFIATFNNNEIGTPVDILEGEKYDVPQMPFGGLEDLIWTDYNMGIIYVTKKKTGTDYSVSTNTDIYYYDIEKKSTVNLTEHMPGYDTNPAISPMEKN